MSPTRRVKKRAQPAQGRSGRVTTRRILTVDDLVPLAKQEVLRLAKNDKSRVEVISPTEARVR